MILFHKVGLIGLGLIGSSLARAIQKHRLTKNIIAYTKSPASAHKALELNIINNIATSISELTLCDIIIICTPLAAYEEIVREIAAHLNGRNCIITDVGSLKVPVIDIFCKYLSKDQQKQLVLAHPIAGTEKTGVESGFAELFEQKKTILTPLAISSAEAISLVRKLWNDCGSRTMVLKAAEHDRIYAEVSHLPQFLAYCYAATLFQDDSLAKNLPTLSNDKDFWRFTRICASNPTIWIDIFLMNKNNLSAALEKFTNSITNLSGYKGAKAAKGTNLLAMQSLAAMISAALVKGSRSSSGFAGSGFADFSSYNKPYNLKNTKSCLDNFLLKTKTLAELINSDDDKEKPGFYA